MPGDQIQQRSIGLALAAPTYQKQMFGVPPRRGTVASQMDMVACPIFDLGHRVMVCMYIDMAQVDMGAGVSMQA